MAHRQHHYRRYSVQKLSIGVYNGILLGFIAVTALSTISNGKCQSNKNIVRTLINHIIERNENRMLAKKIDRVTTVLATKCAIFSSSDILNVP